LLGRGASRPSTAARGLFALALAFGALAAASPAQAAYPGANGKIAFSTSRDGNLEVYTMNSNGSSQTNGTIAPLSADQSGAWSANGAKIAFASDRNGNSEIYSMNANGTTQTRLTSDAGADTSPAWSPNGAKIAFTTNRDGNDEIYVMNADGTGQTRLTTDPSSDSSPAWSPDGTQIAFTSNRAGNDEIFVMKADGTSQTDVSANAAQDRFPDWSSDGGKIAFASDRDGALVFQVYSMNADGTAQTRLTTSGASDTHPAWSPDGTKIAFDSVRDGNQEIYAMNADGTLQTNLSNSAGVADGEPDWQPTYDVTPQTQSIANQVGIVPNYRQTISTTQCVARGGTPLVHAAPFALPACNPPSLLPGTVAHLGIRSLGGAQLFVIPGNPATTADEADYAFYLNLLDVRSGSSLGPDYAPSASGPDITLVSRWRVTDSRNGSSATDPGTVSDFEFTVPVDCAVTDDTNTGSECVLLTTADAIVPDAIREGQDSVIGVFRILVRDSGADGLQGNADDRQFAAQGSYVP
jgi:Tol biopolymer transport system component